MEGSALMPDRSRLAAGLLMGLWLGAIPGTASGLPAAPPPAAASCGDDGQGTFVALSDLHFNPFYDPALVPALVRTDAARWEAVFAGSAVKGLGAYGSDVNFPLLESTLAAAARFAQHPDFVLITGDFLGHNFQQLFAKSASPGAGNAALRRFVQKTLRFATARIRRTFPRTPVIVALGNNDSACGDYQLQPDSSFLADLTGLWQPLLGPATGSFRQTFPSGGYYSLPHPTVPHLRVVVLNTVFFSPKYKNGCGNLQPAPRSRGAGAAVARAHPAGRRAARRPDLARLSHPPGDRRLRHAGGIGGAGSRRGGGTLLRRAGVAVAGPSTAAPFPRRPPAPAAS